MIDINFNFHSDSKGGDPDICSPTLKKYHQILWSKLLPNGKLFELNKKSGAYLNHKSDTQEFYLGSDAITNSYKHHKLKFWLTSQIAEDVEELYIAGSTIGAYTLFPNKKINGFQTINQVRGINKLIDDRFDLTLECIRLFYKNQSSPLYFTLNIFKHFFELFETFKGYVDFFLLNDLVDENYHINFFLPFHDLNSRPILSNKDEYLIYKQNALSFINSRNIRIMNYIETKLI
ncbi:DUF6994 family protein [Pedobacter cryophilus]|uniref:Uncharacterized protein n=1 Tax=Pedobacter cryophilus TaxID=2571271 RepID=A0A4U1BVS2_9SPHI|nr:hypothetical protein [Pedobacter cryophilus]TKB96307.1 hypothetical protein FA046_14070 [Pedobacter cryophilus]